MKFFLMLKAAMDVAHDYHVGVQKYVTNDLGVLTPMIHGMVTV